MNKGHLVTTKGVEATTSPQPTMNSTSKLIRLFRTTNRRTFNPSVCFGTIPFNGLGRRHTHGPFPFRRFLFVLVRRPLVLLFPFPTLFHLFLFLFPTFLFLLPFMYFANLRRKYNIRSRNVRRTSKRLLSGESFFHALGHVHGPIPTVDNNFLPTIFPIRRPTKVLPTKRASIFGLTSRVRAILILVPMFILFERQRVRILNVQFRFRVENRSNVAIELMSRCFYFRLAYFLVIYSCGPWFSFPIRHVSN